MQIRNEVNAAPVGCSEQFHPASWLAAYSATAFSMMTSSFGTSS
jgi:hypothetical protein